MQIVTVALLIVIGVVLFGFVIFFHELGHFLLAKAMKVQVNEFAIGMGPKLLGFRRGETLYSLRLFPIGGYCAMEGEDGCDDGGARPLLHEGPDDGVAIATPQPADNPNAFWNKPVWKRVLVIVAGGVFNVFLGLLLMALTLVPQETFATTQISKFTEGSTLQAAGAQVGDRIVAIDGYAVRNDRDMSFGMALANPDAVSITVQREGQRLDLGPFAMPSQTLENGRRVVSPDFYVMPQPRTAGEVLGRAGSYTVSMVRMVLASLKGIVSGQFGLNEISGPVGTAQAITQAAEAGLAQSFGSAVANILQMIILITVNLGVVNLLPLPALDGGRLLFLIWEGITRKPVPSKYEGYVHAAGFVLLIGLMVVITFNDIARIFTG